MVIEEIRVTDDRVMVFIAGNIYVDEATVLRERLFPYLEQGYKYFVFDMGRVTYMDSSGLGVLVAIQKRALQHGGGVTLKGLQGGVKELFELTRLTKVFEIT